MSEEGIRCNLCELLSLVSCEILIRHSNVIMTGQTIVLTNDDFLIPNVNMALYQLSEAATMVALISLNIKCY